MFVVPEQGTDVDPTVRAEIRLGEARPGGVLQSSTQSLPEAPMSRTHKDLPWELGGDQHKYATSPTNHSWFTRMIRRRARALAKSALRTGREPEPKYPVEHEYYD